MQSFKNFLNEQNGSTYVGANNVLPFRQFIAAERDSGKLVRVRLDHSDGAGKTAWIRENSLPDKNDAKGYELRFGVKGSSGKNSKPVFVRTFDEALKKLNDFYNNNQSKMHYDVK